MTRVPRRMIAALIAEDWPTSLIMAELGVSYDDVQHGRLDIAAGRIEAATRGQLALREAARLESARVYSQVQREHRAKDDPPVRLATIHPLRRRTA